MNDDEFYNPEEQTLDELSLADDLDQSGIDWDIAARMAWMLKDF